MSTLVISQIGAWSPYGWPMEPPRLERGSLRIAKEVSADNAGRRLGLPALAKPCNSKRLITALVALWALILCWKGVSWAFRPRTFLILGRSGDLKLAPSCAVWKHSPPVPAVRPLFDRPLGCQLSALPVRAVRLQLWAGNSFAC